METGVVIIQEPGFTKTSVEEAPAGVVLDQSTMEVDKVKLSTALDDCRNSIIPGERDVAEVVNGSGNKETEESKHEKEEAMKTISIVEDSGIVKEKAGETEKDEQGNTFVHEPESFNKNTDDAKINLSDVTLEKKKDDDTTQKQEEVSVEKPVIEEDQTENKHSQEQEKDIGNISKVLVYTASVESGEEDIEKSLDSAREEIPIKTDEVKEEKDSRTVETSVNGTEAEHNATVSVEESSRNDENIAKESAPEKETETNGESVHDVETSKRVLIEAEKEAEPRLDTKEKDETETVKKFVRDPEIVNNEETTVHESESLKEDDHQRETAEPVETIKRSEDAEKISHELEEDITRKTEEVKETPTLIEMPSIQGEDIKSKASKDTEDHEHVLVRDIPQYETPVPKAETVNTSTVQESEILKTLETKSDETDAEPSPDLKGEEETVKTITSSDEVQESITVMEPPKTSPDQISKDTEEDEHVLGRNMPQGEVFVTEAESLVTKEDTEPIMDLKEDKKQEKTENFEEIPSDLALKVDKEELKDEKIKVDQVFGAQTMEQQRGLELNESEAEKIDRSKTDETEENPVEKLVAHRDVESVEQMEKPSLGFTSEVSEETSKNLDEKTNAKLEEEVPPHQEDHKEGSYGSGTKEKTVPVPIEQGERTLDLTPLKEETYLPIEQDKETKLQKEQIHNHEPANEEVKYDQVIEATSASPSEERESKTIVEAEKIEEIKANEEEQVAEKIQRSLETVATVDTKPVKSNEADMEESLSSNREEIHIKSKDKENVKMDESDELHEQKASRTAETSVNGTEDEHNATVSVEGISRNIANEKDPEDEHQCEHAEPLEAIKNSDDAEKISHEVPGEREKEEDITRKTEEVQEIPRAVKTPTIQEENIVSVREHEHVSVREHEHVSVRDMPQIDTLVTEAEDVNTSTVEEAATSKTLETTINETEVGQETIKDIEPSLDLKEDKEKEENEMDKTVISSDEVRPSDRVDVQAEESGEVKSKETLQDEIDKEKHTNLLDVPSGDSEKFQVDETETVLVAETESRDKFENIPSDLMLKADKKELKDDKTEVDKVDGTQVMVEPNEAELLDRNKTDEPEETPVEKPLVESVEKIQSSSRECPKVSEETSTIVDEKLKEKIQEEESTLHQEGQEKASYGLEMKDETVSVPESKDLGVSSLPKETKLQQEQIEKYEPTNEVPNDQQNPVEEKSNEVIHVLSASPSEKQEDGIAVDAVKLEDIKANEEEEEAEKIQKSFEPLEIAEPQSLLPSCSEEQEHEAFFEKVEDEEVKKEEPIIQTKANKTEDDKLDEHLHPETSLMISDKRENETLTADAKKGDEEMPQGETIVTDAEAVVLNTLEKTINESEAVHSPIGGEEERQVTEEVIEPSLDLKEDKEQEKTEMVKTVILSDEVIKDESQGREESVEVKPKEIVQHESTQEKDENLLKLPSGESDEKMQRPSIESPSEQSEETSKTVDEKIEQIPVGIVTLHQESQETKEETVSVPESSELGVQAKEGESCPPNEQVKEKTLQKEQIDQHESTSEEDSSAHQSPVEEKSGEVIQVLSAPHSEEKSGETLVEAEKIDDIKENEEEHVAGKIQRSVETVEIFEPHSSLPSPPEERETVAEAEKIEDGKVKETEPMGDLSDKGLEVSETKDLCLPLEASRSHGTESSELVAGFEEQNLKQVKEVPEGNETKTEKLPVSETIPQETLSDVVAVQIKREDNATESHERQEELSKEVGMEETMVAQEEQTRDIGTSLIEKYSMDQTHTEEQVNEESPIDEQEKASSKGKGETKTKELEEENIDEHVDSSEKNDNETLIAETKKEDEDKTVGLDGSGTRTTSENICTKQEEFENLEAPKLKESKEDKSQEVSETIKAIESKGDQTASFISEREDQIPKKIEEIHEEETKEAQVVVDESLEKSPEDQTPTLVSEQVEEIHEPHKVKGASGENLPVEAPQAYQDPSSELVSELDEKNPKQIEEIHDEETKANKLQEEEILPTETVSRESSSETPLSVLACGEDDRVTVQEGNFPGDIQEERHASAEKEDDQIENSTKVTKVEDEDTEKTDTEMGEITEGQSLSHGPENACLKQEELKDLGTLQPGAVIEDQDSLKNDNSNDFTFSKEIGEGENEDDTSSTLPVVGILKELQNTLEENERAIIGSEAESSVNDLPSIKTEPETLEKSLVTDMNEPITNEKPDKKVAEESPASEFIEENRLQQDKVGETEKTQEEEGKVQDSLSREFEVDVEEKLQEETREIGECKEEAPADRSVTEVVPGEKTRLPSEELEHVVPSEKQVERELQQDVNASTSEKISLQEEDPRDFETCKKGQNAETHETVKEEDQIVDIKEEKKNEELQDEKLSGLSARRDTEEIFSSEVNKDQEDASELGVGHDSAALLVEKEEEAHSEINEVVTSEKQITDPMGVMKKASKAEHESNEEHIEIQPISDDTKSNNDRDFPTEEVPATQRAVDKALIKDAFDEKIQVPSSALLDGQDLSVSKDLKAPVTDKDTSEKEQKSNDLKYVQEDNGANVKPEIHDDDIRGDGHDSAVAQKQETGLTEEKREVDYVKTEPEDAIIHGVLSEERHKASEKIEPEATKEICQEESKQTYTLSSIKEETREEEKETTHESFNSMKNTDDTTEKPKPEIQEIKNSSSISDTQDKSPKFEKQEIEEPKQKDEVPKLESLKIAEEMQQKDGESEPLVIEPARKSLSDLIQKVKGTNKTEDATTKPHIEEEPKAEEDEDDGDEQKDDKTSPDSIVIVEAKDTVTITKTQHKKSQGILSGVGSKVKHSISKVKKALTGKSSHTAKPSSPQ